MGTLTSPPPNSILIAVDGGGSKTDAVALDLRGNVVARRRTSGSSPQILELGRSVDVVDSVIAEVLEAAGRRPLLQSNVYLSGLDLPAEIEAYVQAVEHRSWATGVTGNRAVVDNDMFALLRAGTESANAVAVVCGTGINCVGVRDDGEHARFPSLGMISGDWGGGWFLGQEALWHAARAVDGRGRPTELTARIPAMFGLADVQSVVEAFHFGRLSSDRLSGLVPLIFAASDAGDAVAQEILDRQAHEIVALVIAAVERLDLVGDPVPVVLGGGVLAAGNTRLLSAIADELSVRAPQATVALVRSRPILGAALLVLESVGADRDALDTARASLAGHD